MKPIFLAQISPKPIFFFADCSEADFTHARLYKANFENANLSKAKLVEAFLMEANLSHAGLVETDLTKAQLKEADLSLSDLTRANLKEANFGDANLLSVNLTRANLKDAKFMEANLSFVNLTEAYISDTDFWGADLSRADLSGSNCSGTSFEKADLRSANFAGAKLTDADFSNANLAMANLSKTIITGGSFLSANLAEADLSSSTISGVALILANMVMVKIDNASISNSYVFGVNVWDLQGEFKEQKELIISLPETSIITVDNIKIAQFIYLILNNTEIRNVLNTLTSKTVLILGRFALPERKVILDSLRNKLREYDLLPIVFDFERPDDKDFTETIKTLAGMCYFVIADVTNPKSSPLELQATVPDYQIPFVPIIQEGERPFAMMVDLQKKYDWVLDTISYKDGDQLIRVLKKGIIDRAMQKHDELRLIKVQKPTVISASHFEE